MKSFTLFPVLFFLVACSSGTPEYDATGTFEATDVVVLSLIHISEPTRH